MDQTVMWCLFWVPQPQSQFVPIDFSLFTENCKIEENDPIPEIQHIAVSQTTPTQKVNQKSENNNVIKRTGTCSRLQAQESDFSLPQEIQNKHFEQKSGRNSNSNILRTFTKFLKTDQFKQVFQSIAEKIQLTISFKQFFTWMGSAGFSVQKYVRIKKIMKAIKAKPQYGKLLAILYNYFQRNFARPMILTSVKTQHKNILPSLKQIRKIGEGFSKAIQEGYKKK